MYIVLAIVFLLVAAMWGDWKNWKSYYPTILFFIIGDLTYNFLTTNKPLWMYKSPILNHTFIDLSGVVTIFPATILLFIPYYPKGFKKQVLYIIFWVFIYTLVEYSLHYFGYFTHHNGWNIIWTVGFNFIMFPLLYLHYKKPLLVWPISFALAFLVIYIQYTNK